MGEFRSRPGTEQPSHAPSHARTLTHFYRRSGTGRWKLLELARILLVLPGSLGPPWKKLLSNF